MEADFWGELTFRDDEVVQYRSVGDLHIWLKSKDSEFWIGHRHSAGTSGEEYSEHPPEDLEWARWAVKPAGTHLKLLPVFPDLPIVVYSEHPLKVQTGTSIQIFTRIPAWVRIGLSKADYTLVELPSVKLSRTWFGTPVEGELCYWSATKARRSLSNVESKPYLINCPIRITNKAKEDLDFTKFCYRVDQLNIYEVAQSLWADETLINFQGEKLLSDITMTGKLPKEMGKGRLISGSRNKAQKNLAIRTFHRLLDENFILGR
jgi:hypothetical protein